MTNFTQLLRKVMTLTDLTSAHTALNNERARRSAINGTSISPWVFLPVTQFDYASGNIITNGNCESSSPAPSIYERTGAATNATFTQDATHVHTGSFAFELSYTSGSSQFYWNFVPNNGYTNLTGLTWLIPGSTYTFSAWVYVPSSIISLSNVFLLLQYSTNGTSWNGTPIQSNSPTAYNTYQRLIFPAFPNTFTLPSNATGISLQLVVNEVGAGEAIWVDDIYLRSGTPVVVADLRNSINSMINYTWTQSSVEYGYETALGQSEILWKINRLEENAETCNNACVGFCQGCSNQCGATCSLGCGVACANGCGGACAVGCGTVCASGCGAACQTTCGSACQKSCSSCTGACSTGCSGTCFGGSSGSTAYTSCTCGSNCSSTCGGSCSGCYTTCSSSCGTSCTAGCGAACQSGCGNSCAGGCGNACANGCGTSCQGGCGLACQAGCGGCSTQCYNLCTGTCGGACTVSCGANCTAIASYATYISRFITSPYFSNAAGTIVDGLYNNQIALGNNDITASVVYSNYVVLGGSNGSIASFDTVNNYWKNHDGGSFGTSNGPYNSGSVVNGQSILKLLVQGSKLILITQNYVASYDGANWKNYDGSGTGTGPYDNDTALNGWPHYDACIYSGKLIICSTTYNWANWSASGGNWQGYQHFFLVSSYDGTNWKYYNGTGTGTGPYFNQQGDDNSVQAGSPFGSGYFTETIGSTGPILSGPFLKCTQFGGQLILYSSIQTNETSSWPYDSRNIEMMSFDGVNWTWTGPGTSVWVGGLNTAYFPIRKGSGLGLYSFYLWNYHSPNGTGDISSITTSSGTGFPTYQIFYLTDLTTWNGKLVVFGYDNNNNTFIFSYDGTNWKYQDATGTGSGPYYGATGLLNVALVPTLISSIDYVPSSTHYLILVSGTTPGVASWDGSNWKKSNGTGSGSGPYNDGSVINSQGAYTASSLIYTGLNYLVIAGAEGYVGSWNGTAWIPYNTLPTIITSGTYFTNNPPTEYFGVTGSYTSFV